MKRNEKIWIAIIVPIAVAAIVMWWLAYGIPSISDNLSPFSVATTTPATAASTSKTTTAAKPKAGSAAALRKNQDVATIIRGLSAVSTFNTYFRSTGVAGSIPGKTTMKYTVFAPTNGAFAQLPVGTVSRMTTTEKKRLIQYHVIAGRAMDMDAVNSGTVPALSGDILNFSFGASKVPMVNSAIVVDRIEGTNGVVIVIDNVLLPPKKNN